MAADDEGTARMRRHLHRARHALTAVAVAAVTCAGLLAGCSSPTQQAPVEPRPLDTSPSYSVPPTALRLSGDPMVLHVAPDGNDAGPGTEDAPFATIGKAASVARPGMTVLVADGTYEGVVITVAAGRADARITYLAENKWGAKLVADAEDVVETEQFGSEGAVWHNYGDYVDIRGFDISGTTTDGLMDTGSYVRLLENRVYGATESCLSTWAEDYALHDIDIIGNVVFGCGETELHHGIYPSHPRGTISNNISYDNSGYGIHCWHNCNELVITNNVVFNNKEGGILIGQGDNPNFGDVPADGMLVANNIAVDNGRFGIRESGATGPGNQYLHNNVWDNHDDGIDLITGTEVQTITTDPAFVDYERNGTGDYRLQPWSPNVDAGVVDGAPMLDFNGIDRPQGGGVDIGAYER